MVGDPLALLPDLPYGQVQSRFCHLARRMMETSAEACWRLSKACGQWAVESRDSAARTAFRQMATEWARLAFNEEFTSPLEERIDPPASSESSEATPVEMLASSLLPPSSENAQPEVERDWTRPHKRLSLPRSLSSKVWGKSPSD
jgi:hypothetical protein